MKYFNNSWILIYVSAMALACSAPANRDMNTEETESLVVEDTVAVVATELSIYDGTYNIQTESDGVNSTLELKYNGDQTFNYKWKFDVSVDEADCHAAREGVVAMNDTQHGVDMNSDCVIHFNFNGLIDDVYVVEVDFADQALCKDLKGECIFSGTYTRL